MKKFKNLLVGFLVGVGIGALIDAILAIILGENFIGIREFLVRHDMVYVRILQCLVYGGFGFIFVLMDSILQNKHKTVYLNQIIQFCIIFSYFIFAGNYLKWFVIKETLVLFSIVFFGIYFLATLLSIFTKKYNRNNQ